MIDKTKSDTEVVIYQTDDGKSAFEVNLKEDTVWLSLNQMSTLFQRNKSVISRHIKNIFQEEELIQDSVVANLATTALDGKTYQVDFYNLDVIISVGYRVKSKEGIRFRMWATQVLKQHLIRGYSVNEKRFREESEKFHELKKTVQLLSNVLENQVLDSEQATSLLKVITDYTHALDVLDDYDHQCLKVQHTSMGDVGVITYKEGMEAIDGLRKQFGGSDVFGLEKDDSFQSSMSTIYQSFGGQDLYPSIEEKAANLLYFIIKNHSFVDGNKRIAAFIFVWFLERNKLLYRKDGSRLIADNALAALTLLIAQSKPDEKEVMVNLIVNLINKKN